MESKTQKGYKMLTFERFGNTVKVQVENHNTDDRGLPDESLSVCPSGEVRLPPRATFSQYGEVVYL